MVSKNMSSQTTPQQNINEMEHKTIHLLAAKCNFWRSLFVYNSYTMQTKLKFSVTTTVCVLHVYTI